MTVWSTLDTSISGGQAGHLSDHEQAHNWANAFHTQLVTSNITVSDSDGLMIVSTTGAARTLTLPASSASGEAGYTILRAGQNNVIINPNGSDTFNDGSTQKTLATDGAAISVAAVNGRTVWYVAGERGSVV
jgi:hypothetical protein